MPPRIPYTSFAGTYRTFPATVPAPIPTPFQLTLLSVGWGTCAWAPGVEPEPPVCAIAGRASARAPIVSRHVTFRISIPPHPPNSAYRHSFRPHHYLSGQQADQIGECPFEIL